MEFVICDDEKPFRNIVKNVINKIFIGSDEYYHISEFEKYDTNFQKLIRDGKPKIYILDIEMNDKISGIDIARKIRKRDWESIIILVTSHTELGYEALKAQIMLLDFISKYSNCEKNLEDVIKKAMSKVNSQKTISFTADGISYVLHLSDIVYIEKDTVDRKCIVKTVYNEIEVSKTLNYIKEHLDDSFYVSHRSCIINTKRISKIDWKNNIIYFDTGASTNLIARDKKKGLKKYVGV